MRKRQLSVVKNGGLKLGNIIETRVITVGAGLEKEGRMSEEEKGKTEGEIAIEKEIYRQTGRKSEGPRQRMLREREREREREGLETER